MRADVASSLQDEASPQVTARVLRMLDAETLVASVCRALSQPPQGLAPQSHGAHALLLEGLIGVGKSSLASRIVAAGLALALGEPVVDSLLVEFYADRTTWAMPCQMWFLAWRALACRLAHLLAQHCRCRVLIDRSVVVGDRTFATANHSDGAISDRALCRYEELAARWVERANADAAPATLVVLKTSSPQVCLERLARRATADADAVTLGYMTSLEEHMHHALVARHDFDTVILDWDDFGASCADEMAALGLGACVGPWAPEPLAAPPATAPVVDPATLQHLVAQAACDVFLPAVRA